MQLILKMILIERNSSFKEETTSENKNPELKRKRKRNEDEDN